VEEYLQSMGEDMTKACENLQRDFAKVRTGRATPKLLESVQVEVPSYGATMRLTELATIKATDARLLTVTPWDKTTVSDIERGIISASLGLNPSSDGQIIRVPVPPLSAERRQDLVKIVRRYGEEAKIRIRHIRREYNEIFKDAEKDGDISEDESRRLVALVQENTDNYVKEIDEVISLKESEVLEV
jgi:ribosome recycling factor